MKLVEALVTYKEKGIKDKELNRIPEPGEQFEVTEERLEVLLGNNSYNEAFVKVISPEVQCDELVSEEEVQAVAGAIVEQAKENDKTIEEVVNEIVEESKEEIETDKKAEETEEKVESKKKKNKRNSK